MGHSPPPPPFLFLILFFSALLFQNARGAGTSIVFTTLGRSLYNFDLFSLPTPPLPSSSPSHRHQHHRLESQLTDGQSVNYNGFFPTNPYSLLSLLPSPPPSDSLDASLEALVYVSERNGTSNVYVDFYPSLSTAIPTSGRRRVALQVPSRVQLPLLRPGYGDGGSRVSMKDRPSVTGEHLVYVSTHEDPMLARKSWAAVYSTHLPSGTTRRLTPHGIADFSPAVSPSGEWTAVASSGEEGWSGEVQDLYTDIYVFRTSDGSGRRKVVDHGGWPTWADDSTLYFHRQSDDGWWSVYRVTIGATGPVVERATSPGFHALTPAAGRGFVAMATRRPTSDYRHIEIIDLETGEFVEVTRPISPNSHHYNPFVSPDSLRIGYHRCRGSASFASGDSNSSPLLLESLRSPRSDINLFRLDGSYPSFSPDGKRIAYVGLPGLYVVNSDGSGKQQILSGNVFATAWDWKRKGVIYTSYGPVFAKESTEVDIISITLRDEEDDRGGASVSPVSIKQLSKGAKNNAFPSPSPDGKWLVFRSGRSGHKNLYIMDAVEGETVGIRRLTEGPWTDTMCNWSPDGEWIAFSSDRENPGTGSFALYFIHPNGTGLRKVVHSGDGGRTNHPFFSPDSKSFVFTTDYAAVSAEPVSNPHHYQPYGDIFTARIDGSEIQRLTHNSYEDGTPTWGPAFMAPADIVESPPRTLPCSFEDCQWLAPKVHNDHTPMGCRAG